MKALFRPKTYCLPKDVDETVSLLSTHGKSARILAGGTDLMVQRPPDVETLVDLSSLSLHYIKDDETQGVRIGAATSVEALEHVQTFSTSPYRALAEAAGRMATPTVRNMATIGGNLCNASPAADLSVTLMAMDGVLIVQGLKGQREIPIRGFFIAPNATALQEDEMLIEIHIPIFPEKTGTSFCKLRHHQTSVDIAIVNVATRLQLHNGQCATATISMGAVGPTPLRAKRAEDLLIGESLNEELLMQASQTAMEESNPIDDIRASADYRKKMVAVLVKKSLETSRRRCGA
jgi:CO/xanthine dehydrogenase FAD-binding subunit